MHIVSRPFACITVCARFAAIADDDDDLDRVLNTFAELL
jgi:hypothetical protein